MTSYIGVIYRHSKYANVDEFLFTLDETLKNISSDNKLCYILGDLNIDIYDTSNNVGKNFFNLTSSNALHSPISMATRITPSSVTTIDHILSNESHFKVKPALFQCFISDHYAVFSATSKLASTTTKTVSFNCFNLKQFDCEKFCSEQQTSLENNMLNVLANEEVDFAFKIFSFIVSKTISRHAPRKKLSRSQKRKSSKSWLTKGILTSIRKKQRLYRTQLLSGNSLEKNYLRLMLIF